MDMRLVKDDLIILRGKLIKEQRIAVGEADDHRAIELGDMICIVDRINGRIEKEEFDSQMDELNRQFIESTGEGM